MKSAIKKDKPENGSVEGASTKEEGQESKKEEIGEEPSRQHAPPQPLDFDTVARAYAVARRSAVKGDTRHCYSVRCGSGEAHLLSSHAASGWPSRRGRFSHLFGALLRSARSTPFHPPVACNSVGTLLRAGAKSVLALGAWASSSARSFVGEVREAPEAAFPRASGRSCAPASHVACYSPFRPQQRAAFCGRGCRSGRGVPPLSHRRASRCPAWPRSRARAAGLARLHPMLRVTHRSGRSNAPPFVGAVAGRVVVCHLSPTAVHHAALPSPPNLAALPLSHSATACRRRRSMEASAQTTAPAELTPREVGLLGPYLELRDVRCDCAGHFSPAQLLESTIYVVE